MKKLILTSITLATLFASSAFSQQTANGIWSVKSRTCSSGNPAQDRFELGRDTMHLAIQDSTIIIFTKIQGEEFGNTGEIDQVSKTISVVRSDGELENLSYKISGGNKLTIVSTGFGEGGSCNPGEELFSVFETL